MTPLQVAADFLDCFCRGDIDGLADLLDPKLKFEGPFFSGDGRDSYVQSLRDDPPAKSSHKLLNSVHDEQKVALFYDYIKPEGIVRIGQWFEIKDSKIAKMMLVFNVQESK